MLFDRPFTIGVARAGDTVLDLGTGTGTLGRGFAVRGCSVTGLDPAQSMLDEARRIDAEACVATTCVIGCAEELPFDDATKAAVESSSRILIGLRCRATSWMRPSSSLCAITRSGKPTAAPACIRALWPTSQLPPDDPLVVLHRVWALTARKP